jgi:NodT family efflux transporter outer membrane factor (OMF) lipoprotein
MHDSRIPHMTPARFFLSPWPRRVLAAAALASLVACAGLSTPYQRPDLALPTAWEQATSSTTIAQPSDTWWRAFGDVRLDRLVEAAYAHNADLAQAALRVRQARLSAGLADNDLRPSFSASLSTSTSRPLEGGAASSRSHGVGLSASYEVDLWGRLARLSDSAQWELQATEQDRRSAALTLAGTTTSLYWQLAYQNQRLASAEQSLAYARRAQDLVLAQYRSGAVSALELREAEQAVSAQQAAWSQYQQARQETRTALSLLFGEAPGQATLARWLPEEPQSLAGIALPGVDAGLPAQLLARRPDLQAAESRLRGTLASADATEASFYPKLTLTGSLGGASTALGSLLANPVATLGAGLVLPLLNQRERELSTAQARTGYESAVIGFRQTLYQALGDVGNTLSARERLAEQATQRERQLVAAREIERLYEARYRSGAATLKLWLDAQEQRRSAELAWAETRWGQLDNQVALYKALGGDATPMP